MGGGGRLTSVMKAFLAAASEREADRQTDRGENRDVCVSRSETEAFHYSASLALTVTVTKRSASGPRQRPNVMSPQSQRLSAAHSERRDAATQSQ